MAVIENPGGSRATRLRLKSVPAGTTMTQWHLIPPGGEPFIVTTTPSRGEGSNILGGSLSYVDIWLPPLHTYDLKTRHFVTDKWKDWSDSQEFTSRSPLNSFEKYQALNRSAVDNILGNRCYESRVLNSKIP